MALGDIYQLKLSAVLAAQFNLNVFHYQVISEIGGAASALDLQDEFEGNVLPAIAGLLASPWIATALDTVNLGDLFDFASNALVPTVPGTRAGDSIAPVVTWSFIYNRLGPGTRSGWKRFSGLAEPDVAGQNPTAFMTGLLDAAAVVLGDVVNGVIGTYTPVVVSRPITLGIKPIKFYQPSSVEFKGVGSQTSRKRPFGT